MCIRDRQYSVYKQLEEVQRKNWKELTRDEMRGAYYVAYGEHGPRKNLSPPGTGMKVFLGTVLGVSLGLAIFFSIRSIGTYTNSLTIQLVHPLRL